MHIETYWKLRRDRKSKEKLFSISLKIDFFTYIYKNVCFILKIMCILLLKFKPLLVNHYYLNIIK